MGKLLKYMGSSDTRRFTEGEDFSGLLAEPLSKEVVWNRENKFVVDTDEAGLSEEAVEALLELTMTGGKPEFKDVTGLKRIPTNEHQRMFMGMKDREDAKVATSKVETTEDTDDDADASEDAVPASRGGGSGTSAPTTTRGGGSTARSGSRGSGGTTVGGSTAGT